MEVIKGDNRPTAKEEGTRSLSFVRKELNVFGKIFVVGCYTVGCLYMGATLFTKEDKSVEELSEIRQLNQEILDSLGRSKGSDSINIIQSNKHFSNLIEKQLMSTLKEREDAQSKVIATQEEEIADLKYQLSKFLNKSEDAKGKKEEVVPYNRKNMRVLRYEQRLQKERFREMQLLEKETFIKTVDMKDPASQNKFQAFLDQQKVELYKLEQDFIKEQELFKQKKFRIVGP